jgi:hypothetical protein
LCCPPCASLCVVPSALNTVSALCLLSVSSLVIL